MDRMWWVVWDVVKDVPLGNLHFLNELEVRQLEEVLTSRQRFRPLIIGEPLE